MSDDHAEIGKSILSEMLDEAEKEAKRKNIGSKLKAAIGARWRKIKKGYLHYRKEVMEENKRK